MNVYSFDFESFFSIRRDGSKFFPYFNCKFGSIQTKDSDERIGTTIY